MCSVCPVLEHCRIWSIETYLPRGFVAGMSENERKQARFLLKGEEDERTDNLW